MKKLPFLATLGLSAALVAGAAPVVVQKGSVGQYIYIPAGAVGNGGGAGGPQETLQTCVVWPAVGYRTIDLSTRNWYGYSKPVNVIYKMVGGGAGITRIPGSGTNLPQHTSAGGSTAILKNGAMVNFARGMHASEVGTGRVVVGGSFTVTNSDVLAFANGGGAGAGIAPYNYTGTFNYYALPGGAGSGYYGGGAGQNAYTAGAAPTPAAAVAMGGTNNTGGTGAANGGLGVGATNPGSYSGYGGNGDTSGSDNSIGLWTGYLVMNYIVGGGGGRGQHGRTSGDANGGFYCPAVAPGRAATLGRPTAFDLDPAAGTAGFAFSYQDPAYNGHNCYAGGGMGQIVLQYQALTCDLIPNWNE
jgi:hypothetical protein